MLDTLKAKPIQFALFDQTLYEQVPTLYERIIFAPPEFQKTRYRVAGEFDQQIGQYLGNVFVPKEESSHGYLVALRFEDGSIEAFHPYSLFPIIEKEVKE